MKLSSLCKRVLTGVLAAAFAIGAAGCGGGGDGANKDKFLNIATGGTAGTYYPIGGAMAEIINKDVAGVNASAQATGASVANINMLKEGRVELGIVQNDITYYAVNGTEMFDETGKVNTAHTTTPVPFIVTKKGVSLKDGKLADIAPTILDIMGIPQPAVMTGESLMH